MDVIGYPGLPGLFVACLYSGALRYSTKMLNIQIMFYANACDGGQQISIQMYWCLCDGNLSGKRLSFIEIHRPTSQLANRGLWKYFFLVG